VAAIGFQARTGEIFVLRDAGDTSPISSLDSSSASDPKQPSDATKLRRPKAREDEVSEDFDSVARHCNCFPGGVMYLQPSAGAFRIMFESQNLQALGRPPPGLSLD
jgi:hypothetical protein